jgi:hypothetical protein
VVRPHDSGKHGKVTLHCWTGAKGGQSPGAFGASRSELPGGAAKSHGANHSAGPAWIPRDDVEKKQHEAPAEPIPFTATREIA